jgi:hypothetical protein
LGATATATAPLGSGRSLAAAAMAAAWLCCSRGRDRQSGDTRGEEKPNHRNFSSQTAKRSVRRTVPTAKRMEPAV